MKLALLTLALIAAPALLAPTAAAWPPVCIEREVGGPGGNVWVHAWTNCGTGVEGMVCPKDGFCTEF